MSWTQTLNLGVVVGYLLMVVGVGAYFAARRKSASGYMLANRNMPGWAVGMSMFGSYISSISFLANPATSYKGNWMYAGFTFVVPISLLIGATVFMRFYRRSGTISAYAHFEHRFGLWARTYAVFTFLLLQTARMGMILFLLSQAVLPMLGGDPREDVWLTRTIIIAIGLLITFYTMFGGIEAVVWLGVIQSVVLIVGPLICLATLVLKMPGGLGEVLDIATAHDKFSVAPYGADLAAPTFLLVTLSALLEQVRGWGTDQSYVQRYVSTRSDRDAARSIWIAGLMYMPVACFFWFIGTALFAFYTAMPDRLGAGVPSDSVFPHFITHELLPGFSGLVIAAIFAASMDSNLNSMATLTLMDGYKRYFRPHAGDRESLIVLYLATFAWGVMSMGYGFIMTLKADTTTTLEFSMRVGGLLAGGLLGLFLLGLFCRRVGSGVAAIATLTGVVVITWMSVSRWPALYPDGWYVSPVHEMLAGPVGTAVILVVGLGLSVVFPRRPIPAEAGAERVNIASSAT